MQVGGYKQGSEGISKVCIKIADVTIALHSNNLEFALGIEGPIQKFLVDERDPDIRIQTSWDHLLKEDGGRKLFDSGSVWQLYSKNGSYFFRFASSTLGSLPYKVACFNRDFTEGEVLLHHPYFHYNQPIYPLEYPLDELLLTNFLALGRGVEIHGCGVVDSLGRGHLFVGQSGAGKSTTARLWENEPNITILSDDRIILRKTENVIWMYGTPWHGDAGLASPARVPLTTIYFLEKGQKNELIARKPADSIGHLFACSFPPFYSREGIDFTLAFLEDVAKKVPCYELMFKPDKHVVEFIQEERFT